MSDTRYIKKQYREIIRILHLPEDAYTEESFHKLRVAIKKLSALADLIQYCDKNFPTKKTLAPFRKLFRQAGKIREWQIAETLLKATTPEHSTTVWQQEYPLIVLQEKNSYFTLLSRTDLRKLKKKYRKMADTLEQISAKQEMQYLSWKTKKIRRIIRNMPVPVAGLHALRKALKTYHYNKKYILPDKRKQPNKELIRLMELLGQWHDYMASAALLQNSCSWQEYSPAEAAQLSQIILQLQHKSEQERELMNESIKKLNPKEKIIL